MGYRSETAKPLFKRIIYIVGIAVAVALLKPTIGAATQTLRQQSTDYSTMFDQKIAKDPRFSALMSSLKANFPVDYEGFKSAAVKGLEDGKSSDELHDIGFMYMRNFGKKHLGDLAQTPSIYLNQYWQKQGYILKELSNQSMEICSHYAMTGLNVNDRPSEKLNRSISEFGAFRLLAMRKGIDKPAGRSTDVTDSDYVSLFDAMKKDGLTDRQLKIFADNGLDAAPDADKCQIGIIINTAIGNLPTEKGERLKAWLILNSG